MWKLSHFLFGETYFMLLLFKQQIQELFDYAKEDFFKKKM